MTIKQICKKYSIENYTINGDTVDVNGDVHLSYENLKKLPLKFGTVTGHFNCSNNELTSLDGAPKKVGENFSCHTNNLTSLEGALEKVGRDFICHNNNLTSELRCAIIDANKFYTDFGILKIPKDKHEKIKWIFEND